MILNLHIPGVMAIGHGGEWQVHGLSIRKDVNLSWYKNNNFESTNLTMLSENSMISWVDIIITQILVLVTGHLMMKCPDINSGYGHWQGMEESGKIF